MDESVIPEKEIDQQNLDTASMEIDHFLELVGAKATGDLPPEVPRSAVDELTVTVEEIILRFEATGQRPIPPLDSSLLEAIGRVAGLATALDAVPSEAAAASRTSGVLQRSMNFLEEEFRSLLEDDGKSGIQNPCTKEGGDEGATPTDEIYPAGTVERLRKIAETMIFAGYESECCQPFSIVRRVAVTAGLAETGFEKAAAEVTQRMPWQKLEGEISTWIAAFRRAVTVDLPRERRLCEAVFACRPAVSAGLFSNLARGVIIQLLNFAEAVTATQISGEKLFKFLDMYEAMRDLSPETIGLFAGTGELGDEEEEPSHQRAELKSELTTSRSRIGDAVMRIFSDLESSIRRDTGKTPVPGGDVHPLTRYVMNYLKYACEYKGTLEEIYRERQINTRVGGGGGGGGGDGNEEEEEEEEKASNGPFARQLIATMDLLEANLEAKSKLYRDQSLRYIFLMNNGRYMVQKLKGWMEINEVLGVAWCRRRSSELRQHHKNYQRETWGRVLGYLKDEGLQQPQQRGGGAVSKTALKERFKSFNSSFEEIHKTQTGWVVRDEQLQSELRVSVSAVVVPAYRSFLGRYRHYLEGGKQSDRYIKYAPEDLENCIDQLFDPKQKP